MLKKGKREDEKRKFIYEILVVDAAQGRLLKDGDNNKVVLGYMFSEEQNGFGKPIGVGDNVLIQDKISNEEGIKSHQKTAQRIYNILKERRFDDLAIHYFGYDDQGDGVDEIPSKNRIQWAIGH